MQIIQKKSKSPANEGFAFLVAGEGLHPSPFRLSGTVVAKLAGRRCLLRKAADLHPSPFRLSGTVVAKLAGRRCLLR